jgi:hypothetical protein
MVQWLLECLNPASSASMTRSKAIKALGEVVQVRIWYIYPNGQVCL